MGSLTSNSWAIVEAPLFVLAFLWLSFAVGRRVLCALRVSRTAPPAERGIASVVLGAGTLQFVPVALAAFGRFDVPTLRWSIGALTLLSMIDLVAVAKHFKLHWRQRSAGELWSRLWLVALVPGLLALALLALSPTLDPDGLIYHLVAPKRWLHDGTLSYLPTYMPTNAPMGFEMLFSIALVFGGDVAAKVLHFAFGVLAARALYLAAVRLNAPHAGVVAATLFLIGPTGAGDLLGAAYLEGATAYALAASTLAWLIWLRERDVGWLRCAALSAGIGVSFKLTAALFPVALLALTVLVLRDPASHPESASRSQTRLLSQLIALMALPVAPWFVRSALITGNPVFPLFARWIPSRDFSPTLAAQYDSFNRYFTWASSIGPNWDLERRQQILVGAALIFVAIALLLLARARSGLAKKSVCVLLVTTLVQLFTAGLYVRYWVPLLAVLLLPIAALFERLLSSRAMRVGIVVGTLICSMLVARKAALIVEGDVTGLVGTALGTADRRAFLARHIPLSPLFAYVNQALPEAAGVLLVGTCIGFYMDRSTYCVEFPSDAIRFSRNREFMADLHDLGVTHVMAPLVLGTGGPLPPVPNASVASLYGGQQLHALSRLLSQHGRLLIAASDQGLFALDLP